MDKISQHCVWRLKLLSHCQSRMLLWIDCSVRLVETYRSPASWWYQKLPPPLHFGAIENCMLHSFVLHQSMTCMYSAGWCTLAMNHLAKYVYTPPNMGGVPTTLATLYKNEHLLVYKIEHTVEILGIHIRGNYSRRAL